ncbi:MAG: PleD family two-component system response regulator [Coleofasciculaceae cyanobacterium]
MKTTQFSKISPVILVADDDKFIRLMLRQVLEKESYQVEEACNGEECLSVYKRIQPNIVLLDAMMPVMNGFECCRQLQHLPNSANTPILMLTGLEDPASVDLAFQVGATDYVTKPIHWAVLRQRVRQIIEKSHLYRDLIQANLRLRKANENLQQLASIDSLTQVANRRSFDEYLSREWKRSMRELSPLSLILCDVDFFKAYNDTYGHQAGDDCLRAVAGAISKALKRPADIVARYGGEEFAVILPNVVAADAAIVAQLIRFEVNALKITHASSGVSEHITLSQGVASIFPKPGENIQTLVNTADQLLYKAKARGRDRFECWRECANPIVLDKVSF